MKVRLGLYAWKHLGLPAVPDERTMLVLRSCFYLGFNLEEVRDVLRPVSMAGERDDIVHTAKQLGMTDNDIVVFDEKVFP